jgi:hypothetical protein
MPRITALGPKHVDRLKVLHPSLTSTARKPATLLHVFGLYDSFRTPRYAARNPVTRIRTVGLDAVVFFFVGLFCEVYPQKSCPTGPCLRDARCVFKKHVLGLFGRSPCLALLAHGPFVQFVCLFWTVHQVGAQLPSVR